MRWVDPCLASILAPWMPCSCSFCASTAVADSRLAVTWLPVTESHSVCPAVWSFFHGKCSLAGSNKLYMDLHKLCSVPQAHPQAFSSTSDPSKFPFFSLQFLIKQPHQCHWQEVHQFSHSVVSDSLWPHGLQHGRLPCPSPTPGAYSNSCPLSRWCHPTISSCCPLLLPPSIFPSIRVFSNESALHIRWPKYWSFSFSISPSNELIFQWAQDWAPLGWTGWISLQSKGLSRVFSNTTVQKHQFFGAQLSL